MSPSDDEERRSHVLHRGDSAARGRHVEPLVLQCNRLVLACGPLGDIQPDTDQGLYYHDMRHLSGASLTIDGEPPVGLGADASGGHHAVFLLTNQETKDAAGATSLPTFRLCIERSRSLEETAAVELIDVQNSGPDCVRCQLELRFEADFADMLVVRGAQPGRRGTLLAPVRGPRQLTLGYDGADGHARRTQLTFSRRPSRVEGASVSYDLRIDPQQTWQLRIEARVQDGPPTRARRRPARDGGGRSDQRRPRLRSDSPLVNAVLERSFADLDLLRVTEHGYTTVAAGLPWYMGLFGRDTLLTCIELIAFDWDLAEQTLRLLAHLQGQRVDDWRDEQPGKILHELRWDEMSNLGEVPFSPYYGSVDATPLFLVLLGLHARWTGSTALFEELRPAALAALEWIATYGDTDGDGLIDYQSRSPVGARNQGWKDSGQAVVMLDGALAEPPIALPLVQGVVYLAWRLMAELFGRTGDAARQADLQARAEQLRQRFNTVFWLPDEGYYAFCRQADGQLSRSITSDPAAAVWTGIIAPQHVASVARRVLAPDLYSGWGVRTLSSDHVSYNPLQYQVGSVWPHDNAFIADGLYQHGLAAEATWIVNGLLDAAAAFPDQRLPELFAGLPRSVARRPIRYPVACSPQAFAAASMPFMFAAALGWEPDGWHGRLRIRPPALPERVGWIEVEGLRVGGGEVDLRYERRGGRVAVQVLRQRGALELQLGP